MYLDLKGIFRAWFGIVSAGINDIEEQLVVTGRKVHGRRVGKPSHFARRAFNFAAGVDPALTDD
jgi:hypothetical protein